MCISMNIEESLAAVEKAIIELIEKNKIIPIIVEGKKDKRSLRKLGVKGKIIAVNQGLSLSDFCDDLVKQFDEIIILTDWDRKGGILYYRIKDLLKGRIRYDTSFREQLGKHAMIKTVEGLYSWIKTMNKKI